MGFSQLKLSAFASGIVVPIEAVPDPVFAGRMLGDGLAIDPTAGVLYAPCDGTVAQLHRSHHACVLESADGVRMLLHIGIDTVLLKGEGFTPRVAEGEAVRAGQPLIEFDIDVLKRHGKPVVISARRSSSTSLTCKRVSTPLASRRKAPSPARP